MKKLFIIVPALLLAAQLEAGKRGRDEVPTNNQERGRSIRDHANTVLSARLAQLGIQLPTAPLTSSAAESQASVAIRDGNFAEAQRLLAQSLRLIDSNTRLETPARSVAQLLALHEDAVREAGRASGLIQRGETDSEKKTREMNQAFMEALLNAAVKYGDSRIDFTDRQSVRSTLKKLAAHFLDPNGRPLLRGAERYSTLYDYLHDTTPLITMFDLTNISTQPTSASSAMAEQ